MATDATSIDHEPTPEEISSMQGPLVLEFGTAWCGFCQAARPLVTSVLADVPGVPHIRIEDGKGRRLGRAFGVKLWPTLIFLRDGVEKARVVRPQHENAIRAALDVL